MNQNIKTIIISAIVGALVGGGAIFLYPKYQEPSEADLIKEFYLVENAVYVSPHEIRKATMKGETNEFTLVDLRSEEEYLEEHIIGAVNIPAYKDRERSDYGAVQRIRQSFRELREKNPNKELIIYCYSIPCMTGRKVGKMLAKDGIYVKHLGVGWNEWRYFWKLWNHPHEWGLTDPTEYVVSGPDPGVFKGKNYLEGELPSGCSEGELSC